MAANGDPDDRPVRIAIAGGGCAGITAAFELSRPIHEGRHQITIYQQGWRLGGKGASGRGVAGRIEEHGLHVWLGYYENAFRLIREAYEELAAHPLGSPYGDWREAFLPEPDIGVFAPDGAAGWRLWRGRFPPRPGLPGDRVDEPPEDAMRGYVAGALAMLRTLLLDAAAEPLGAQPEPDGDWPASMRTMLDRGLLIGSTFLTQALLLLGAGLEKIARGAEQRALLDLAEQTAKTLRGWIEERFLADHPDRYIWLVAELVMASLVGTVRHRLIGHPEGLDSLDEWDCRDWLRANGASEAALRSPFMQGVYDLAMAYEDGDAARPRIAAGAALRGTVRMFFSYRGALFWRMRAGMGDVVFAPLYECLRRRGVAFRFFHRLTDVVLAESQDHVSALHFDAQAALIDERSGYDPLITVAGRPCWPAEPRWDALQRSEALDCADLESHEPGEPVAKVALTVGRDFDFVVLAVGVAALPDVASAILQHNPRWRAMVDRVKTTATQSFQIWLRDDLATLGWNADTSIASAFAKPFDTWCDMRHVIPEEGWLEAGREPPGTAVYFCGVLADQPGQPKGRAFERAAREAVRESAVRFLDGPASDLWPGLRGDGALQADVAGGKDRTGSDHFYWRANVVPSDRYTLCVPGATRWRISPLALDYDNLTVAGDWTANGLNTGCTEAAVMSGMLAAHALSGLPPLEAITGFDHP